MDRIISRFNRHVTGLSRRVQWWLATGILASLAASTGFGQSEVGVKAAFIYNFAKFTEWPGGAFASDNAPITVAFVGADALADTFEKNVTGKNANGRDFTVKKLTGGAGLENCQIVFVGAADQASSVVAAAKGKPVLTIGDGDGFATAGGMISFVDAGGKISFDLDFAPINTSGLKLDAKLRQVARKVKGG